jgi:hypothetical protein
VSENSHKHREIERLISSLDDESNTNNWGMQLQAILYEMADEIERLRKLTANKRDNLYDD